MGIIEACRRVLWCAHAAGLSHEQARDVIAGFESQLDDIPLGSERELYDPALLEAMDREVRPFIEQSRSVISDACEVLRRRAMELLQAGDEPKA